MVERCLGKGIEELRAEEMSKRADKVAGPDG
jgi:hypothetical protein